jgi:hypothetical protein
MQNPVIPCHCGNRATALFVGPLERTLRNDAPELEYSRDDCPRSRHAGQLKLLCSEIQFLMEFRNHAHVVIYAGASPGMHIPRLARMFPEMTFVMVDPTPSVYHYAELEPDTVRVDRVVLIQDFMTDELAAELAETHAATPVLFISDVRNGYKGAGNETERDHQLRIQRDMDAQLKWHDILKPAASMFKFRLPWDLESHTLYPEGVVQLPVYGRHLTHETRLVVRRGAVAVPYDNRRYERQMAYFNRVRRAALYQEGLCYDCMAFRAIVADYLGAEIRSAAVRGMCRDIELELQWMGRRFGFIHRLG